MLNVREMDVLNILWKSDVAMTSSDITDEMKELTQSTVVAVLRKLLREELVEIHGVTRCGKVLSRTYRPTEKSRKVLIDHFLELYELFCAVVPAEELAAKIMETGKKVKMCPKLGRGKMEENRGRSEWK